jgi:pantoate--beta-alanine ligase
MQTTHTIDETRQARSSLGRLAIVPTMGALHEGHLSLIRLARQHADRVAVSIFVNPTQFAPHEDLDKYPRPIERDLDLCRQHAVDLVFNPGVETIYPPHELPVEINVPAIGSILEGEHRPQFFPGVCRVVAKLFNIVQPDAAVFGQKDYQQLKVIEAMVAGLNMPIEILAGPTLRDPDGLAMSSRNVYLDAGQRKRALSLSKALREAEQLIDDGVMDPQHIESAMRQVLRSHDANIDYAVVRDARSLQPVDTVNPDVEPVVGLIAAKIDHVRLIDNRVIGQAEGKRHKA